MAKTKKRTKKNSAPSMEADAGLLGSTKPELKRIKALGCRAFSESRRVDIDLARQ